ncbi:MAG: CIA30 family protein, partial [Anaerolineales bacterium]|nr:CIA30 family protein [Anaerolineales bacterium]
MYREGASGIPTLSLSAVASYFIQFSDNGGDTSFAGTFAIDQMAVFGPDGIYYINGIANPPGNGVTELSVQFEASDYTVIEGNTAVLTATLNTTSTVPVTVTYATTDGTAVAGTHYTANSGTLVFPPNSDTQTITVGTIDNSASEADKALTVTLSDPVGAILGNPAEATLTIEDDEIVDICSTRSDVVDDFENGLATGVDGDGNSIGFFTFKDPNASTTVTFTTNLVSDTDPLALPGQSGDNTLYQVDLNVASYAGTTHAFENIPVDTWTPQDWSSYAGISFWFYGQNTGTVLGFEIQDNRQPGSTTTDTEIWNYTFTDDFEGWKKFELRFSEFSRKEIGNGAPNDGFGLEEVHSWAFLSLETDGADVTYYMDDVIVCGVASDKPLSIGFDQGKYTVDEGGTAALTVELSKPYTETVSVDYATAEATAQEDKQYMAVSGTLTFPAGTVTQTISVQTIADEKYTRDTRVTVNLYQNDVELGFQRRAVLTIVDTDMVDPSLVDDFEGYHPYINQEGTLTLTIDTLMESDAMARPGQAPYEDVLTVEYDGETSFNRIFSQGQDWSGYDGVSLWVYGQNSGDTFTYTLHDNMTATTATVDPEDWVLVWSDEFNDPAGTPPNPNVWKHEIGDGALNNIVGWGNSELQYYSNDPANASTDGLGNLVIRMNEVNTTTTDLVCWYGPCEYTSARLITQDRIDFEYGRVEARVQVPGGPDGLWPAFWMLGSDITEVDWPQSGEID